mmetsp:Transcript_22526/g.64800  ORF Transcript_22526/g.64800 Transcript_22526/m.64800 type:complete len:282 (-) Transcript_22526:127-972(-)
MLNLFLRWRVNNVFVHLIRKNHAMRTCTLHSIGNVTHLLSGEDLSSWIVRGVENHGPSFRSDGLLQLFRLQYPLSSCYGTITITIVVVIIRHKRKRHVHGCSTGKLDLIDVQVKEGFEQDHLIAGLDERLQAQIQSLAGADGDGHLGHGINVTLHVGGISPRQLLHQVGMAGRAGVLMRTLGRIHGRLDEAVDGKLGREPVGKALAEVGHLVFLRQTAEFGPHRRSGHGAEAGRCFSHGWSVGLLLLIDGIGHAHTIEARRPIYGRIIIGICTVCVTTIIC